MNRFVIGGRQRGVNPARGFDVQPGTVVYMGASSSPDEVYIDSVTDDFIKYRTTYEPKKLNSITRWIGEDLIAQGCETWLNSGYARYNKERAKSIRDMQSGKKGKKEKIEDYHRVVVTVKPSKKGEGEGDLWYKAEEYGSVGAFEENGIPHFEIRTMKSGLKGIRKNKSFTVVNVIEESILKDPIVEQFSKTLQSVRHEYKSLLGESWMDEDEEPGVDPDTKRAFLEEVGKFNQYSKVVHREGNLIETAKKLSAIARMAERVALQEQGDWFDNVTVQRNMQALRKMSGEFGKIATNLQTEQDRCSALFEDMGHILNRYFEIHDLENEDEVRDAFMNADPDNLDPNQKASRPVPRDRKNLVEEMGPVYNEDKMRKLVDSDEFLKRQHKAGTSLKVLFNTYVVEDSHMTQLYNNVH